VNGQPRIESIRFGKIVIDGHAYKQDVLILPDRVLPNWWRVEGHTLSYEDLQQALSSPPEVLVIGTGMFDRMKVPEDVRQKVEAEGVELQVHPTKEACEYYNRQCERRRVAAGLHLTC